MLYIPGRLVSISTGEVSFPRCYMRISPEGYFAVRGAGPGSLISKYDDETFQPCTLIKDTDDADTSGIPTQAVW